MKNLCFFVTKEHIHFIFVDVLTKRFPSISKVNSNYADWKNYYSIILLFQLFFAFKQPLPPNTNGNTEIAGRHTLGLKYRTPSQKIPQYIHAMLLCSLTLKSMCGCLCVYVSRATAKYRVHSPQAGRVDMKNNNQKHTEGVEVSRILFLGVL